MLRLFLRLFKWLFIGPKPKASGVPLPKFGGYPPPATPVAPSNGFHAPDPSPAPQFVLEPQGGRLVVERMDVERVTGGGIVLPDSALQEKNVKVYCLAVSPPWICEQSGRDRTSRFKVGDHLVISRYAGEEVILDHGKVKVAFVRESDVLARINFARHADHIPDAMSQPPPDTKADLRYEGASERREAYDLHDGANR